MKSLYAIALTLLPLPAIAQGAPNPCADPAGFARHLVATNPGTDYGVLALALDRAQVAYGCRAPAPPPAAAYPATTRCQWEGFGIARQWVCRAD